MGLFRVDPDPDAADAADADADAADADADADADAGAGAAPGVGSRVKDDMVSDQPSIKAFTKIFELCTVDDNVEH
jgi:hypothetical protein